MVMHAAMFLICALLSDEAIEEDEEALMDVDGGDLLLFLLFSLSSLAESPPPLVVMVWKPFLWKWSVGKMVQR